MSDFLAAANTFFWHDYVLFALLGTGIVFTIWSGFSQYFILTHGSRVLAGAYDDGKDPGAISHFQALSAALSATVGLGNIGGVALAIALGGPGAVFWMWVVGFFGMAIKVATVTQSMLFRNTDDPENPHGGPMWVVSKGLARRSPGLAGLGRSFGVIFCVALLINTASGGNMFQSWNVGTITNAYFGVPNWITGVVLACLVGAVIIGGIKRIGRIAGILVPGMVFMYLAAAFYVLAVNVSLIPEMFGLIFRSAFSPQEASGAFIGGSVGYAFLIGMKRALFSNEAGQGLSPIAHAAARTDEPAREGLVGGMEPFIDTLVVCTLTALVILSTGVWNRGADTTMLGNPEFKEVSAGVWQLDSVVLADADIASGNGVFTIVRAEPNVNSGNPLHKLGGVAVRDGDVQRVTWATMRNSTEPRLADQSVYVSFVGATLTARAFDTVQPGLGKYLITLASWLFAISTMIAYNYYGEQAMIFLSGQRFITPYKIGYCALIVIANLGLIKTDADLDNITGIGTAILLMVNFPILWVFGRLSMRAYRDYIGRLKDGSMARGEPAPDIETLLDLDKR